MICTGTGIAPFRSMVNQLYRTQTSIGNFHLIFGCRKKEDLLYYEELKELENKFPGFRYHPVLSRETWDGPHGYVHPIYQILCHDRQPARFFLCGWKHMIDEAIKHILELGYEKKAIHQEIYG